MSNRTFSHTNANEDTTVHCIFIINDSSLLALDKSQDFQIQLNKGRESSRYAAKEINNRIVIDKF